MWENGYLFFKFPIILEQKKMPPQLNLWKKTFSNHLNVDKSAFWEWKTSAENRQKIVTQNRWGGRRLSREAISSSSSAAATAPSRWTLICTQPGSVKLVIPWTSVPLLHCSASTREMSIFYAASQQAFWAKLLALPGARELMRLKVGWMNNREEQ